jgi:hypothetical protein
MKEKLGIENVFFLPAIDQPTEAFSAVGTTSHGSTTFKITNFSPDHLQPLPSRESIHLIMAQPERQEFWPEYHTNRWLGPRLLVV